MLRVSTVEAAACQGDKGVRGRVFKTEQSLVKAVTAGVTLALKSNTCDSK